MQGVFLLDMGYAVPSKNFSTNGEDTTNGAGQLELTLDSISVLVIPVVLGVCRNLLPAMRTHIIKHR